MPGRGIMKIEPSAPAPTPPQHRLEHPARAGAAMLKIAHVEDEATGNTHDRFRAPTVLGGTVEFDVPHERSESAKQVLAEGRKKGAALATPIWRRLRRHRATRPSVTSATPPRNGWYGPQRRAFVAKPASSATIGACAASSRPGRRTASPY